LIEEVILDDEVNRGKRYTMFLLSRKDYSIYKMNQKLHTRDLSENSISIILKWLEENNYINDESYALSWALYRINNKCIGRFRLNQDLKTKRIKEEIREKVIEKVFGEISEIDLARKLVRSKMTLQETEKSQANPKKIYNLLVGRGFSTEIARNIFFELLNKDYDLFE